MKVLVISDAGMDVNKGGFPQTLYNIFSFINPRDFLFITSLQANTISPTSQPFTSHTITYNIEKISIQHNRLGKYFNRLISWFNYSISTYLQKFEKIKTAIRNFNPDVVVVAPNSPEGVFIYNKLKTSFQNTKTVPYFMDDWLYQSKLTWLSNNIHSLTKKLLNENKCWMMISDSLAEIFSKRFNIEPSDVLEIHNPVDLKNYNKPLPLKQKEAYTIAYAGALWQMHFDAFLVIAKAVKILSASRKINLVVYTAESNWKWRENELHNFNVVYGGLIPYKNIHAKLSEADCLLITSSFSDEWQTHSKGSVQTKLTDYLKAGRLVIGCGPVYSANHYFIKKNNCGICIETNNENEAAEELNTILNNIEASQHYVDTGFEVLKSEFSFEKVHKKFTDFIGY